jgi:hypothetical protein
MKFRLNWILLLTIVATTHAQEQRDPQVDDAVRRLEEPATASPVYLPDGSRENPIEDDGGPPTPTLVREGAFLLDRRGILVPVSGDRWAFVFDKDALGNAEAPMLLQPCLRLSEMIRLTRERGGTPTFLVSGRVYVYAERNHLLPQRFSTLATTEDTSEVTQQAVLDANEALRDPADTSDPSVEELLARLQSVSAQRQDLLASGAGGGVATEEGRVVVSRRGRLSPGERGLWVLLPDNGPEEGEGDASEPLVLMPCQTAQAMGELARRHGDRISFIVSGALFSFEGRSFLLPSMFQIERDRAGEIIPAQ